MNKVLVIRYLGLILFLALSLFFSTCKNKDYQKFVTIFIADKNFFIPVSFVSSGDPTVDAKLIVREVAKIETDKVEITSDSFNIFLKTLPNVPFEFDSYILYSRLFLSFFNTFDIKKVNFFYNNKLVTLGAIEYSMYYQDYYKYPVNDIFNLGDARKGKYYLYRYLSDDGKDYFIPILLPKDYDISLYFSDGVNRIKKVLSGVKLWTFDKFFEEKLNFYLLKYDNETVFFRTNDLKSFLNFVFYDKERLYFVFYNSGIENVYFLYKLLFWDLSIKIGKPKNLYLNTYPINFR